MKEKKCKICGKKVYLILDGIPLCTNHYVEKEDKECLMAELDIYVEDINNEKKLDENKIRLLKVIKKNRSDVTKEFPIFFNKIR